MIFYVTYRSMKSEEKIDLSDLKCGYPDCCFMVNKHWFRYRAGALIVEDGKLLVMKTKSSDCYYTVGGGVHMGESAESCVLREVQFQRYCACRCHNAVSENHSASEK